VCVRRVVVPFFYLVGWRPAALAAMLTSRTALLLLLLVFCRSPSNADFIHEIEASQRGVVPATSDAQINFAPLSSSDDNDNRKLEAADDDVDAVATVLQPISGDENAGYASKRKWGNRILLLILWSPISRLQTR